MASGFKTEEWFRLEKKRLLQRDNLASFKLLSKARSRCATFSAT